MSGHLFYLRRERKEEADGVVDWPVVLDWDGNGSGSVRVGYLDTQTRNPNLSRTPIRVKTYPQNRNP